MMNNTNWYKKSQSGLNEISIGVEKNNPLNGKNNQAARKYVSNIIYPLTKGLFSDQDWSNVRKVWDALDVAGLDWNITDNEYGKNEEGTPVYKMWKFEIRFNNNKNRPTILHGVLTAHGAGSIQYPLDKYDISATVF